MTSKTRENMVAWEPIETALLDPTVKEHGHIVLGAIGDYETGIYIFMSWDKEQSQWRMFLPCPGIQGLECDFHYIPVEPTHWAKIKLPRN